MARESTRQLSSRGSDHGYTPESSDVCIYEDREDSVDHEEVVMDSMQIQYQDRPQALVRRTRKLEREHELLTHKKAEAEVKLQAIKKIVPLELEGIQVTGSRAPRAAPRGVIGHPRSSAAPLVPEADHGSPAKQVPTPISSKVRRERRITPSGNVRRARRTPLDAQDTLRPPTPVFSPASGISLVEEPVTTPDIPTKV